MFFDQFENLKPGAKVISNQRIKDDYIVEQGVKGEVVQIDEYADEEEPNILVTFFYPIYADVWVLFSEIDLVKE